MTAQQTEAPQAVKCGATHPSEHARCTRDPRHKGGHRNEERDLYWQAEEASS